MSDDPNKEASTPATTHQGKSDTAQTATTIGPLWQWLKEREGAVTALSTLLLMFFTGALVVATILLFSSGERTVKATRKVAEAAKEAADAAQIAQRPWVSIKAKIGKRGLFYDANGANLDLVFLLNNTGNTPAITVRIEGGVLLGVKTNDTLIELEKVCTKAKSDKPNPSMVGWTIFPKDQLIVPITYSFADKRDLDKLSKIHDGFITPRIIGCVDYFITFGGPVHHQSRFVYTVFRTIGQTMGDIRIADGDREASSLVLAPSLDAGSFQAD
jgi:hypothetical protein